MAAALEGAVALMTGASSGIGDATARELAARGAAVALVARRKERLDALAAELRDGGGSALVIEADVSQREQAEAAVRQTVDELGGTRRPRQQRGRDAARAGRGRAGRGVGPDGRGQRPRAALLSQGGAPAPARGGRGRAPRLRGSGEHLLRGGPGRACRQRRLQPDEVRRRRLQRGPAPGGHGPPRARLARRAGRGGDRAGRPQPARGARDARQRFAGIERLEAQDIADAIAYVVTRPRHVAVNELLVRPTEQQN